MGLAQIITGFGLAGAAGLNAYIPLLITAILGRLGVITLNAPFDILTSDWVIVVLGVLLLVEFMVDKVPGADSVNDVIQTVIRPAAGAILFAANSGVIGSMAPEVSLVLGLIMAFSVHATKAVARPVVNTTTLGVGAPVVSVLEDVTAFVGSVLAIFFPLLFLLFTLIIVLVVYRMAKKLRRNKTPAVSA